jgi:hypothetical protein
VNTVTDFKNNPRALHTTPYNDGSAHYVDNKGNLLCMAFPAVVEYDARYSRTGPYFSLEGPQGMNVSLSLLTVQIPLLTLFQRVDIGALTKAKAVWVLRPLFSRATDIDDIPQSALDCTSTAMNTTQTFFAMTEERRNKSQTIQT